jgi:hypothetical protein
MIISDNEYRRMIVSHVLKSADQAELSITVKECLHLFAAEICKTDLGTVYELNEGDIQWSAGTMLNEWLVTYEDEYHLLLLTKSKLEKFILTRYLNKNKMFLDEFKSFIDCKYSF